MRRFRFGLEALLAQRRASENEKLRAYAMVLAECGKIECAVKRIEDDLSRRAALGTQRNVARLAQLDGALRLLTADLRNAGERLACAAGAVTAATRDRKAIEALKRKQFEEYRERAVREEERELDEANRA